MKQGFASAVAVTLVLLVVAIVVSPFVDLPLTITRTWEGLAITAIALAVAVFGESAISDLLFLPVWSGGSRPCHHRPHENPAEALSLNVARLC